MHALYMNNYIDMDTLFEGVFKKLVSPDFGKNLGGELPLFIQPIPNSGQTELKQQVERLSSHRPLSALYDLTGGRGSAEHLVGRRSQLGTRRYSGHH